MCHYYTVLTWQHAYSKYQYFKKRKNHPQTPQEIIEDTVTTPVAVPESCTCTPNKSTEFEGRWAKNICFAFCSKLRSHQHFFKIELFSELSNIPLNTILNWLLQFRLTNEMMQNGYQKYKSEIDRLSDEEKAEEMSIQIKDDNAISNEVGRINNDLTGLQKDAENNKPLDLYVQIIFRNNGTGLLEESFKKELFRLWNRKIYPYFCFYSATPNKYAMIKNIMETYKNTSNTCPKDFVSKYLHCWEPFS